MAPTAATSSRRSITSGSCAPAIAWRPDMTKHGTPLIPGDGREGCRRAPRRCPHRRRETLGAPRLHRNRTAPAIRRPGGGGRRCGPSVKCAENSASTIASAWPPEPPPRSGRAGERPPALEGVRRIRVPAEQHALGPANFGNRGVEAACPVLAAELADHRSPAAPCRHVALSGLKRNGRHVRSNSRSGRRRRVRIKRELPRKHQGQTRSWTISMPRRAFGGARMFTADSAPAIDRLSREYRVGAGKMRGFHSYIITFLDRHGRAGPGIPKLPPYLHPALCADLSRAGEVHALRL